MSEKKYKVLRVTMEVDYLIEMHDEERTVINGWTTDQVIQDWFKDHKPGSFHATRDAHELMGSKKLIDIEEIDGIPAD